jgi:hypothetical protein
LGVMKVRWLLPAALLLVSCVSIGGRRAFFDSGYPQDLAAPYQLKLNVPTGRLSCSGHGLVLQEPVEQYSIALPDSPPTMRVRYEAAQLRVTLSSVPSRPPVALSGGHIVVDRSERQVLVLLETTSGTFAGNGSYQISSQ